MPARIYIEIEICPETEFSTDAMESTCKYLGNYIVHFIIMHKINIYETPPTAEQNTHVNNLWFVISAHIRATISIIMSFLGRSSRPIL